MARQNSKRDTSPILSAGESWIAECLLKDGSVLMRGKSLWTAPLVDEVYRAFVEHPDVGADDFMTKLKRQMAAVSASAQQLTAEMLWVLLLFPSNMKARTKRQQILELWSLSGDKLPTDHPLLKDDVLVGIGSGGPGFNNYRPNELEFLIALARDLKRRNASERMVLKNYDSFLTWIDSVPREGSRQFRHMLGNPGQDERDSEMIPNGVPG
jgi:5-methylcytosine-specific restriction protein B